MSENPNIERLTHTTEFLTQNTEKGRRKMGEGKLAGTRPVCRTGEAKNRTFLAEEGERYNRQIRNTGNISISNQVCVRGLAP